jgi:uncharacterized membrane protein YbjE (DUF340 family)
MAGGEKMDLDALIDQALSTEPLLRAPLTLQRGVEERLRIADLRDREKMRFRLSMATLLLALVSALFAAGALLWFTNLSVLAKAGVSGGKGQYDYYATALAQFWHAYQGAYTLVLSVLLAVCTLAMGWRPLRKRLGLR